MMLVIPLIIYVLLAAVLLLAIKPFALASLIACIIFLVIGLVGLYYDKGDRHHFVGALVAIPALFFSAIFLLMTPFNRLRTSKNSAQT